MLVPIPVHSTASLLTTPTVLMPEGYSTVGAVQYLYKWYFPYFGHFQEPPYIHTDRKVPYGTYNI